MRQHARLNPTTLISRKIIFTLAIMLSTSVAHAAWTTVEVDLNTVSAVESTTIYGGISGAVALCGTTSESKYCNNCKDDPAAAAGDAKLKPCNEKRIHPELILHIRIASDSIETGKTMMTVSPTSGAEVPVILNSSSTVTKGNVGDIYVKWKELCPRLSAASGGGTGGTDCSLTADQATATFKVGLDTDNSNTLDANETAMNYTVILRDGIAATGVGGSSLTEPCANSPVGICYFEILSGDTKAVLTAVSAQQGFPNGNGITFKHVRVFYKERAAATGAGQSVFSSITPGTDHQDLEVGGSAPNSLTLSPARITGLANDKAYDFKVAVVDAAGNTGYYTPDSLDKACNNVSSINTENGEYECHTARPSEVVNILSEPVNCFVATAAYGSPMAQEVTTFRAFRGRFLVTNTAGKAFVRFYYEYGPILARAINGHEARKAVARAVLTPALSFAKFALNHGAAAALSLLASIFSIPLICGVLVWRRCRGARD